QTDELLVLRDEVGLAVELDERAGLTRVGRGDVDGDEALGRRAVLALGDALEALDAEDLESLLRVAVRLVERLLDVEHAGARALAQRLDVSGGVVRHGVVPCLWWCAVGRRQPGGVLPARLRSSLGLRRLGLG